MTKPFIQIDNELREMTDEEYANYLEVIKDAPTIPTADSPIDAG
jgi:hypothetical protein